MISLSGCIISCDISVVSRDKTSQMVETRCVMETVHLVRTIQIVDSVQIVETSQMIENTNRRVKTSETVWTSNSLKLNVKDEGKMDKRINDTKIIIEDIRRPSVVFNPSDLDKPRTKILPTSLPRRRFLQ